MSATMPLPVVRIRKHPEGWAWEIGVGDGHGGTIMLKGVNATPDQAGKAAQAAVDRVTQEETRQLWKAKK